MSNEGTAGKWFLGGIGVCLILIGAVFCFLMARSYLRAREMARWPEVDCVILRSETSERRLGDAVPPEYRFEVLYGYEWQGARLESDRHTLRGSPWRGEPEAARELSDRYPAGSRARCRVNPADPRVAVLKPDSKAPGYSLWFPALFIVAGAGILRGSLRDRAA